tara:strand:+ start:76153 stop:77136 length:984 start_codon:yes stop_codon:yes gene_type:complete
LEHNLLILAFALLLDRFVGDPDWLWRRIAHPVVWFGWMILYADRFANRSGDSDAEQKRNGVIAILLLLLFSVLAGLFLSKTLSALHLSGALLEIVLVAVLLAQKSLVDHVSRVATGLRKGGLAGGRQAVAMIVGRDPQSLDDSGICRAAIESLAENFSDGVVAPAFWFALFGLPGLLAYKMLNTADSMIGHKNEKYGSFGWASARLDDLVNWLPARLSAALLALSALLKFGRHSGARSFGMARRDAGLHRSPNAGWPESAMAGALGLALAGERIYAGVSVREPMLNGAGKRQATAVDIDRSISVFYGACWLLTGLASIVYIGLQIIG